MNCNKYGEKGTMGQYVILRIRFPVRILLMHLPTHQPHYKASSDPELKQCCDQHRVSETDSSSVIQSWHKVKKDKSINQIYRYIQLANGKLEIMEVASYIFVKKNISPKKFATFQIHLKDLKVYIYLFIYLQSELHTA